MGRKITRTKSISYSLINCLWGLQNIWLLTGQVKGFGKCFMTWGGGYNNQLQDFVQKLTNLIPMGRMANIDEGKAAVLFLVSDSSSYMTGANLIVEGGRTCC